MSSNISTYYKISLLEYFFGIGIFIFFYILFFLYSHIWKRKKINKIRVYLLDVRIIFISRYTFLYLTLILNRNICQMEFNWLKNISFFQLFFSRINAYLFYARNWHSKSFIDWVWGHSEFNTDKMRRIF